jgi:16S rRNA (cytosine967-C5)-methyltransferase
VSASEPDPVGVHAASVQLLAGAALREVLEGGRSLRQVLAPQRLERIAERDRGTFQDCCYGSLRWLGTLRAVLRLLAKRAPEPEVEALVLVALYRLAYTRAAPYAVVDTAVRGCPRKSAAAKPFVNAVLRAFLRDRVALMEQAQRTPEGRYSYPRWWIDRVERGFPAAWSAILDAGNQHPPMTLRVNRRALSAQAYRARLHEAGLRAEVVGPAAVTLEQPMPAAALPGFAQGWVSVQDLGAQFAAPCLDLRDGQRVLDACAAPGGKAAHILETADVDLLALDRDPERLQRAASDLTRTGLHATLRVADAGALDAWWDGVAFQRILLDAPCSGSGVVRRHPDIKWLRRETDLPAMAREQARLLAALWRTLERGGKLLYVTCSVFAEENQARAAEFLVQHADARRLPLTDALASDGQLLPDPRHDGFYYALFEKQ